MRKAQDVTVVQTKVKNLITGKIIYQTFHKGDTFEDAAIEKFDVKFIYGRKGSYTFSDANDPSKRFELPEEQIGDGARFLKSNEVITGIKFKGETVNIIFPVKVQLRVKDAPPGVQGDRSQGGTKTITLETGATLNVPLFVQTDDVVEVNTETGEYVRRV